MRKPLLLLLFISYIKAGAKTDSILHRIIFQANVSYVVPTGPFSARSGGSFFLGQAKSGVGFNPTILVRVHKNFYTGLYLNFSNIWLDRDHVGTQFVNHLKTPEYYTSSTIPEWQVNIAAFGNEYSYKFRNRMCEIEPYINIGVAWISNNNYSRVSVHRKKKNDNYFDDTYINPNTSGMFAYPGIGLRINKNIHKIFYLNFALQYNHGEKPYSLTYSKEDFLGNKLTFTETYRQQISVLQVQLGFQLRVFKAKQFRHK